MSIVTEELLKAALRKCSGVLAEGETPSLELLNNAMSAFNTLVDSWSAESLSVYATQDQTVTWPASTASQTFGPSGDLSGTRPIRLDPSSYFVDTSSGNSHQFRMINEEQYNSIGFKAVAASYPDYLFYNPTMPDATITVNPIPNQALEFHLISVVVLAEVTDLTTVIVLPPGYRRALTFNLACEIAPELGMEPPQTTQRIAMTSKRVIKGNNWSKHVMTIPAGIPCGRGHFNINTGE